MSSVEPPSELLRLVAAEFDRHGWEYDLTIGKVILAEIERAGRVDAHSIARRLPGSFYHRQNTTREVVATVIARAIGHLSPEPAGSSDQITMVTDSRVYHVNIGGSVSGANINIGDGQQLNVTVSADRSELLRAVEALVVGALTGDWNADAARDLAATLEGRDDVTAADVRDITLEVVTAERPKRDAALQLARDIVASGLGGALGIGIATAVAEVAGHLPG